MDGIFTEWNKWGQRREHFETMLKASAPDAVKMGYRKQRTPEEIETMRQAYSKEMAEQEDWMLTEALTLSALQEKKRGKKSPTK